MDVNCVFCDKIPTTKHQPLVRNWYDFFIIFERDEFVAVPAIGSLVPGYILVVYKKHIYSMAQLPNTKIEILLEFCNYISLVMEKLWGPSVVFEHGACSTSEDAGSCISHAHWHIVPTNYDLRPRYIRFTRISSFEIFASQNKGQKPYLFLKDHYGNHISEDASKEKQVFRKVLSKKVNKEFEWDWANFPFMHNIKETIAKVGSVTRVNPTINAYDSLGEDYIHDTVDLRKYPHQIDHLESFLTRLKGKNILDAGSGSCRDSKFLYERGNNVEAIDLSKGLIYSKISGFPIEFRRVMDVRDLAYKDLFLMVYGVLPLCYISTKVTSVSAY